MSIPATGALGFITNPQTCVCSSISCGVLGDTTAPVSLLNLASVAGKSIPVCALSFHSYTAPTIKCVNLYVISSTAPYTSAVESVYIGSCYTYPMALADCYLPNINWCIKKPVTVGSNPNSVSILCNGTIKACCCVSSTGAVDCSGSWNACFYVKKNDTLQFCAMSQISAGVTTAAYACIQLASITNCCGCYCLGGTCLTISENTCGAIV